MSKHASSVEQKFLSETHSVFNQPPPLQDYNLFESDTALREGVEREGAGWARDDISAHGELCGRAENIALGFAANAHKPVFDSHDRYGHRIDRVSFHPSYHQLMAMAFEAGLHASPWREPKPGAHVARAAKYYLHCQLEPAHGCPVTMTFAAVPSLKLNPELAERWLPKVLACDYDGRDVPFTEKAALTLGMGMTEKQGGSDVRANTTEARPLGAVEGLAAYELVGHKWFLSAPMGDGFLMLAQAPGGLSCFLVPRWRPDGSRNSIHIQRLKDKMGNVANASSEVELHGALGWLLGEEGRGVPAIIEMVAMTRFDCMIGSSGGQRQAVAQAVHHAQHRSAFGKSLIQQPLMQNVLADLQLEVEGSLALTLRMARALDSPAIEHDRALLRLGTAVGKYWICKRTPRHAYEAMECIGGNGVMENCIMPRLYREAPINAIWEGSGNIQALDVLRAIERSPEALQAWYAELAPARAEHPLLEQAAMSLQRELTDRAELPFRARHIAEQLALTMQAALLVRAGNGAVSDAFIASRLGGQGAREYGTLPRGLDIAALLDRAKPLK